MGGFEVRGLGVPHHATCGNSPDGTEAPEQVTSPQWGHHNAAGRDYHSCRPAPAPTPFAPSVNPAASPQSRTAMPRGDKSSYTDKQKRQAAHIEAGYERSGVSEKTAKQRAWATVNKESGGGLKGGRQHHRKG